MTPAFAAFALSLAVPCVIAVAPVWAPDERFLVVRPLGALDSGSRSLQSPRFVLNWFEELKDRVPVP